MRAVGDGTGLTAFEAAVVVAVIGGFFMTAIGYQQRLVHRGNELALAAELQRLRAGVAFFEATGHRYPSSLEELAVRGLGRIRAGGGIARPQEAPGSGDLVDAFGNRYAYETASGTVHSRTPGYDSW